jgi:hypothetical protein
MTDTGVSELLAELNRMQSSAGKTAPDMRRAAQIIEATGPDRACERTGMTPLQWAIENDSKLAFHFLLARGANPSARGTGSYDRAPVDMLVEKGQLDKAHHLVERGAECPAEVAAWHDRQVALRTRHEKALKEIPARLEKALKSEAFLAAAAELEHVFGVKAAKARGKKGLLTFKAVPIRKLAKAAGQDEELWFAALQRKIEEKRFGLFTGSIPGGSAKDDINIAPTATKREIVCLSDLLPPHTGASPYERMAMADVLDEIDAEHPFHLLASGRYGVLGILDKLPEDVSSFARRLIGICGELYSDYQIQFSAERGAIAPNSAEEAEEIVKMVARDISKDGVFWLPWGVDN